MNATNRLAALVRNDPSTINNRINHETSIQPISQLTFADRDSHPSSILPSMIATTVPLPPRRDASSLKHHRRRHQIDHTPKEQQQQQQQQTYQPLLNSSTLDDLFRALTLECEQYLAATSSYQNKTYGQMIVKPSAKIQAAVESNDEDYENLHPIQTVSPKPIVKTPSPLKTSIQVVSPIKRHVVSITVSSKVTPTIKPSPIQTKSIPTTINTVAIPTIAKRHSSEEDSINTSSSSTNRKHRRRRTRRQFPSSTGTRSSSSSNERKKSKVDRKSLNSKRSCSTDPRYQRLKTTYDNNFLSPTCSSQQQTIRRPIRRDISLQHPRSNSRSMQDKYSSPLSVLLTSNKSTSDFLDNNNNNNSHQQRQSRRSRLESLNHKSSTLLDRMQQQFYRPSPNRNTNNKNNILTHRIPSYPVY